MEYRGHPPFENHKGWGSLIFVMVQKVGQPPQDHFIDHTQHDTLSILKTIELRFGLQPLTMFDANASSLESSLK